MATTEDIEIVDLAVAVGRYVADRFNENVPTEVIRADVIRQLDVDFFSEPLQLGDLELDSLSILEVLDAIVVDLGIAVFDQDDINSVATPRGLAQLMLREADLQQLTDFLAAQA